MIGLQEHHELAKDLAQIPTIDFVNHKHEAILRNVRCRRDILEDRLMVKIKNDLLRPEVVEEYRSRLARALRRPDPAHGRHQALEREVQNIASAIGSGLLSPALSARLQAAEKELASLPNAARVINVKDVLALVGGHESGTAKCVLFLS